MTSPTVRFMRDPQYDSSIPLPAYASAGAAGADVRANFPVEDRGGVVLAPGERRLIPTGLNVAVPDGYEMQARPRSGLALKHGISIVNTPGTIDADYRGKIGIILINHGDEPFLVEHGDRIAQLVIAPVVTATFAEVESLDETDRGVDGFGTTGTK